MKKYLLTSLIFIQFAILPAAIHAAATVASPAQQEQYRSYIRLGIDKAFNLEFTTANSHLLKAVELNPENPTAFAYLAMINLFAYEMNFDEQGRKKNLDSMLRYVDETLNRGGKRIESNSQDGKAYLAMAMAKIAQFNLANHQKHYFSMARNASSIWDYLEKARENDPQNYDIYFLMGSFRYHIDHLSGMSRFFSALIMTSGDTQKGIQEMELAVQKGDLLKHLAMSELSADYLNFEKKPERALSLIRELRDKYPGNYNFSFAMGNALSDLRRFDDAFNIAREIDKKIQSGVPPYVPQLKPRYNQLMGRILFAQGEYARAMEFFQKALQDTAPYNARVRAWAYVRMGMIQDARKNRGKAEEYYSQALDVEGGEGTAQIEARKYLETPYVPPLKNGSVK